MLQNTGHCLVLGLAKEDPKLLAVGVHPLTEESFKNTDLVLSKAMKEVDFLNYSLFFKLFGKAANESLPLRDCNHLGIEKLVVNLL